ncbi:Retrovirus-related Pol polyprotein from transposon 297 [Vitis vinifera]|uniref:Retrovirus-related Pol polyprotein from transposon 297 n=1 Tax=Vitis vinifera TaxID=29760 RepID=A0A438I7L6_VITVI|nr:Retrovirus-related Pol polyprotein from transposon 297 [Vitis vinifera]
MATHEAPRVEVPKPHTFSGKKDAKELDNFLWHMEHYFEAIALTDEATKHIGSIREYVKEFSTLMLEKPNMSEEELLFNFIDNLKSWVEQELMRCGVQDLATTMAVAESLVEYKKGDSSKPKPQSKGNHAKGGGDKGSRGYPSKEGSSKGPSGKDGKDKDKQKEFTHNTNCFLCDEVLVNGKTIQALVDTSATHNFVSEDEAKRLKLQTSKEGGRKGRFHSGTHGRLQDGTKDGLPTKGQGRATTLSALNGYLRGGEAMHGPYGHRRFVQDPYVIDYAKPTPKEIEGVLNEFKDVMPLELSKRPPRREEDHKIELESGAKPPAMGPYRMAPLELEELRRQLKELLDVGFIQPSKAPYGASVLFQKKHDGSYGCVSTTWHSTRYGSYEFLVMPFGLTNAPTTFCTLMNKIFHPYLDKFVVVYLDDIVIYSNTLKEHVKHLRKVFKILRQNKLYVKKEKCSFAKEEVSFLGHCIKDDKLMMDDGKVKAIQEWDPPTKAVTEEPVLALSDHTKVFEVHTDASDFATGGVHMQDRHLIAFESHKINDMERRYMVQEKEMTTIVHCLCT